MHLMNSAVGDFLLNIASAPRSTSYSAPSTSIFTTSMSETPSAPTTSAWHDTHVRASVIRGVLHQLLPHKGLGLHRYHATVRSYQVRANAGVMPNACAMSTNVIPGLSAFACSNCLPFEHATAIDVWPDEGSRVVREPGLEAADAGCHDRPVRWHRIEPIHEPHMPERKRPRVKEDSGGTCSHDQTSLPPCAATGGHESSRELDVLCSQLWTGPGSSVAPRGWCNMSPIMRLSRGCPRGGICMQAQLATPDQARANGTKA